MEDIYTNGVISETPRCKICGSSNIRPFAHTATCRSCGVLLCYPYPVDDDELFRAGVGREGTQDGQKIKSNTLIWHLQSGARNHHNFTNMALFALNDEDRQRKMTVLDFGGGGGQFALVLRSLFPLTTTYLVDIAEDKLLSEFKPLNHQIKFNDFKDSTLKFDYIFMNDVFEHVSDPLGTLKILRSKLVNNSSRIFIDTPCQFWLYPVTRFLNKSVHTKLLRGTVDFDHQQIWSKKAFNYIIGEAGFKIDKYIETSEFTQPPAFYMKNMRITNPVLRLLGTLFYYLAPIIAKNKIIAVIKPQ